MPFYNANHYQSTVFKQEKDYARQLAVSIGHLNTEHSTNAFHVVNALIQWWIAKAILTGTKRLPLPHGLLPSLPLPFHSQYSQPFPSPSSPPNNWQMVWGSAIAPPVGQHLQTHFGAIHSPNLQNFTHVHKTPMQHFTTFFQNANSVHVVSSSSGTGLSQSI